MYVIKFRNISILYDLYSKYYLKVINSLTVQFLNIFLIEIIKISTG